MPLITCPECGKQISDKSEFCVGCGCPASAFASLSVSSEVEVCVEDGVLRYVDDPNEELTSFTIPEGVTIINNGACSELKLKSITIPEGVTTLCPMPFADTLIEEIVLPKSINDLRFEALGGMKYLKRVKFQSVPARIDGDIFSQGINEEEGLRGILTVELPEGLTSIPKYFFQNASTLAAVVMPKSVKSIDHCAFSDCYNLKSIHLHEGIEEIGALAFYGCKSLTSIVFPKSLKRIGPNAFEGCDNLSLVTFQNDDWAARYVVDGAIGFDFEDEEVEYAERVDISIDELKNGPIMSQYLVHNFVEYAFERGLAPVEIPESVAEVCELAEYDTSEFLIENKVLKRFIGKEKYVTVPRGVVRIESFAFAGATVGTVVLPNTVTSIGDHAFYGITSSRIELSEGLISIGEEAFANCKSLSALRIPRSTEFIGAEAFVGCSKLSELVFAQSNGWTYTTARLSDKRTAIPMTKVVDSSKNPGAFLTAYGKYYLEKRK